MKTMMGFMKTMMSLPMPWPAWIGLLMAVNMLAPIYFLGTLEAQAVLAAALLGAAIQMAIFARKGFVRLLGVGHVFWVPLLPWLWTRLDQADTAELFGYWIVTIIIVDGISLLIDAIDVTRYLNGDRAPFTAAAKGVS